MMNQPVYTQCHGLLFLIIKTGDGISFNTLLGTILFDTKRWPCGLQVLRAAADDVLPQSRNALVSACELQDVAVVSGFGVPNDIDTRWPLASSMLLSNKKRGDRPMRSPGWWKK